MTQASLVRGASAPALLEYTIGEALLRAAKKWPKQEALVSVHQGIRWTYEQFSFQVDRLAASMWPFPTVGELLGPIYQRALDALDG